MNMKKYRISAAILAVILLTACCAQEESAVQTKEDSETDGNPTPTATYGSLPAELAEIPDEYYAESDSPGTLVSLEYDTYESMTYFPRPGTHGELSQ